MLKKKKKNTWISDLRKNNGRTVFEHVIHCQPWPLPKDSQNSALSSSHSGRSSSWGWWGSPLWRQSLKVKDFGALLFSAHSVLRRIHSLAHLCWGSNVDRCPTTAFCSLTHLSSFITGLFHHHAFSSQYQQARSPPQLLLEN